MKIASLVLATLLAAGTCVAGTGAVNHSAEKKSSGELLLPANYHSWVQLDAGKVPAFHKNRRVVSNVYVEPTAFQHFLATGEWPDQTVIVLELRSKQAKTRGHSVVGLEAAVKDTSHTLNPWSYFGIVYDGAKSADPVVQAECDKCNNVTLARLYPALKAIIEATPGDMKSVLF